MKLTAVIAKQSALVNLDYFLKSCSDVPKRSVWNCDCEKNEIAKHCYEAGHNLSWDQKKADDRENRLIPRKIYIF